MNILINTNDLKKSLQDIMGVVSKDMSMPILGHVLMEKDSNTIKITGTNLEVQITSPSKFIESDNFEPITGSIHQPPPVHQTFEANGFVVCSFVSRLFDYHPDAIPSPYPHSNVDSDEVIFYSMGNFMSRNDIEEESITLHPAGLTHGPHPGKYEGSIGKTKTEELAVMIDTFKPLKVVESKYDIEDLNYSLSWLGD